jgi:hypothetical protein
MKSSVRRGRLNLWRGKEDLPAVRFPDQEALQLEHQQEQDGDVDLETVPAAVASRLQTSLSRRCEPPTAVATTGPGWALSRPGLADSGSSRSAGRRVPTFFGTVDAF